MHLSMRVRETDGVFLVDLTNGSRDTWKDGRVEGWMGGNGAMSVSKSPSWAAHHRNPTTFFSFATPSEQYLLWKRVRRSPFPE